MRLVRHGAEPEGNAPPEETDHDRDSLPVDEPGRLREGVVRTDEVEHGGVGALEILWRSGLLGSELERALPFLRGRVADVDGGVREQAEVLDSELPETARAEDERPRAARRATAERA